MCTGTLWWWWWCWVSTHCIAASHKGRENTARRVIGCHLTQLKKLGVETTDEVVVYMALEERRLGCASVIWPHLDGVSAGRVEEGQLRPLRRQPLCARHKRAPVHPRHKLTGT